MNVPRELRRGARALVGPLLGIALTGYFAYNLVRGDRGFLAWVRISHEISAENARLDALHAEKKALDLKVSEMSPQHLAPDLLDERVRETLNLVAPNEVVIMKAPPAH